MSIVEEIAGLKCPGCKGRLLPAANFIATDVETSIKEMIVPNVAAYFGLGTARPSYLVCKNKKCRYCYSANRPFFLKLNVYGKVVPVLGIGSPEPKGNSDAGNNNQPVPQQPQVFGGGNDDEPQENSGGENEE